MPGGWGQVGQDPPNAQRLLDLDERASTAAAHEDLRASLVQLLGEGAADTASASSDENFLVG